MVERRSPLAHLAAHGHHAGDNALFTSLGITTNDAIYNGLGYLAQNPFVQDPIRPNKQDRIVAASTGQTAATKSRCLASIEMGNAPNLEIRLRTSTKAL